MQNKDIKKTIIKLLSNLGTENEVRKYLKRFSDPNVSSFAIIKIGGSIIQNDLDNIVSAISFIQEVGLTPIIVHGAGPQLNQKLDEHGIDTQFIDGKRVTTTDVLHIARKVFIRENQKLAAAFQAVGINATPLTNGLFNCRLSNNQLGLVGDIKSISVDLIQGILKRGSIPIIAPLGETDSGQIVNINADSATFSLAQAISPYKIIFLTETGGVLDQKGQIIPVINLSNDYEELLEKDWIHSGMLFKLQQINNILQVLPKSTSVSINSPTLLAKELFTHRGSGTLINSGDSIHSHQEWDSVDKNTVTNIVDSSFGKKLHADYFVQTKLHKLYLTDCDKGLAIVTDDFPIPYLDKFCVNPSTKGEGVGSSLWKRLTKDNPKFFWRARSNNPINNFYRNNADGFQKGEVWCVYWYGDIKPSEIADCIQWASSKNITVGNQNAQ
ncbi:acetylglutamate kinase [Kangiella sp. TOML190]|uniref:acetylglutamate kinase n=1 Tax=Kangiella sp. TOML190 TaxID=2931351 RepID=UPI00203C8DED|nr:acetylglutamate kinase [Kangiella sp. TOML190]